MPGEAPIMVMIDLTQGVPVIGKGHILARTTNEDRDMIEIAAKALNMSIGQFTRMAIVRVAEKVILEQTR